MFHTEVAVDPSIPIWLTALLTVLGTALGGGGVAAVMKALYDRKAGIEAQETVEDNAIAERWKQLSQAQIEMLLNPLKERLTEVESAVRDLEAELGKSRRKYWTAIPYIRTLLAALRHHAPEAIAPSVPVEIIEDI